MYVSLCFDVGILSTWAVLTSQSFLLCSGAALAVKERSGSQKQPCMYVFEDAIAAFDMMLAQIASGLPWWATISTAAIGVRLALSPLPAIRNIGAAVLSKDYARGGGGSGSGSGVAPSEVDGWATLLLLFQ